MEFAATLDPKSKPTALVRKGSAATEKGPGAAKGATWRDLSVEKRIEYAIVKVMHTSSQHRQGFPALVFLEPRFAYMRNQAYNPVGSILPAHSHAHSIHAIYVDGRAAAIGVGRSKISALVVK